MTAADVVFLLGALVLFMAAMAALTSFAISAINFLTTTEAHRDALRRNRAGDEW